MGEWGCQTSRDPCINNLTKMFEANVARINQLEDTTAEQNQAMSDTKDKIHELEETIHKQAAQIAELKDICESSEHNRCRYNIIIWGLDEQTHSNPREAVHRLFSDLDLHFKGDKGQKQADHYNYKAGSDRRRLQNMEPVCQEYRPNPLREPRTYLVDMRGTIYPRTREHLKPRSIHSVPPNVTTETLQVPTPLPPAVFTSSVEPLAPSAGEPVMTEPVTTVEAAAPMKTKAPMKAGPASQVIIVRGEKISYRPKS